MLLGGSLRVSLIFSSTVCSFCFWAISDWVTSATFSFSLSSFSEVIEEKMEEKKLSAPWRTQRHSIHPDVHSGDIRLPNFISKFFSRATFPPHFWAPKVHILPLVTHWQGEGQVLLYAIPLANKCLLQLPLGSTRLGDKAHYFYCFWMKVILHASGLSEDHQT